jgi:GNAT superfamily N-acetyltransferase
MRITRVDLADTDTIRACFEMYLTAQRLDEPDGPFFTERPFHGWLTVGWGGDPRELWAAQDQDGTVAGWYRLELPDLENLDQAYLLVVVHPARRRRGLGRALLKHAADRAAANGRTVLHGQTRAGSDGEPFAGAVGAERGLVDVQRVMDVRAMGDDQLARLRVTAEEKAAGYSLVSWTGPVPEDFLDQAAALFASLNDAPHDPDDMPAAWDAQRVRERVNALRPCYEMQIYAVAAVSANGEPAAITEVAVDPADPGWGHQMLTGVVSAHRGHRLGLLVKIAMLEWLRAAEPTVARIQTWNAESNQYMIAVNEALGYTILGQPGHAWKLDVAAVLAEQGLAEQGLAERELAVQSQS